MLPASRSLSRIFASATTFAVALTGLATAGAAPASAATTQTFITMVSSSGDYIGGGNTYTFAEPTDSISGSFSGGNSLGVNLDAGAGNWFYFNFSAPNGKKLGLGTYYDAQRYPFNDGYHPGISVSGDGRGCNQNFGQFTIHDLGYSGGELTRLNLTYVQHCEGWGAAPLFGQIVIGKQSPSPSSTVTPWQVEWPQQLPGANSRNVPVTITAGTNDVPVSFVSLVSVLSPGSDNDAFSVTGGTCGSTLAAGTSCTVTLNFDPVDVGAYSSILTVGGQGVSTASVKLSGLTTDGISEWRQATVAPDESGSEAVTLNDFTPADFAAVGDLSQVTLEATLEANGSTRGLALTIAAPAGEELTEGTTYLGAEPAPGVGSGLATFDLLVDGQGCEPSVASFAIHELAIDPDTGDVLHMSLTYKRSCSLDRSAPAQLGSVGYLASRGPRALPTFGELDGVNGTVLAAAVSPGRPTFGDTVSVNGSLERATGGAVSGKHVYLLQREVGSSDWNKVARTRTGPSGYFYFQRFAARNVSYMVDFRGTDRLLPSASTASDLVVRRQVVAQLDTATAVPGEQVQLYGYILPRESGVGVTAQYLNRQGKWRTLASDVTNSNGRYTMPLTFDVRRLVTLRVTSDATPLSDRGISWSVVLEVV